MLADIVVDGMGFLLFSKTSLDDVFCNTSPITDTMYFQPFFKLFLVLCQRIRFSDFFSAFLVIVSGITKTAEKMVPDNKLLITTETIE